MFCHSIYSQDSLRDGILNNADRRTIISQQVESLEGKKLQDLVKEALNPLAKKESRIAAAVLLLRNSSTQEAIDAALGAMSLEMPAGPNDWEEASDWTLLHPVAAEAALHPDLLPQIVQRTLSGELPESVVGFVLLHYQSDKIGPHDHLAELLKTNLPPEKHQRCERLIAVLKGETGSTTSHTKADHFSEITPTSKTSAVVRPASPAKASDAKRTPRTQTEEPAFLTPFRFIVVLIVAVLGLVWVLLKKRK